MIYTPDLKECEWFYHPDRAVKAVGWLSGKVPFETAPAAPEALDRLWDFCAVSIEPMCGYHFCDICETEKLGIAEKNGIKLVLGNAEIRVFSPNGGIYRAPNLIYHYMSEHHYKPPDEFIDAVLHGPKPPDPAYFQQLHDLDYDWEITWDAGGSQIPRIETALREALEHRLNCKVSSGSWSNIQMDWYDELIRIITFRLIDHPTHQRVCAWYMKPKGADPRPYLFYVFDDGFRLMDSEHPLILAHIEEYRTLDDQELDRKYGRINANYATTAEIVAEFEAAMRRWPGGGPENLPVPEYVRRHHREQ